MTNNKIWGIIGVILLLIIPITGCLKLDYSSQQIKKAPAKYELTKTDIFSQKDNWKGTEISVLGAMLGDSTEDVIEKIGLPDIRTNYQDNSVNFEYREGLTLKSVGLLFHFKDNILSRITVKKPFDKFLVGQTKIENNMKDDIFRIFRNPSKMQLLTFFTMYTYEDRNLEIFVDGKEMNGFSFVLPEAVEEFEETAENINEEREANKPKEKITIEE